jgi:hypothetical protein
VKRYIVDLEDGPHFGKVREMEDAEYTLYLQRSVCDLIHLAKRNGLNGAPELEQGKELIRCLVLACGLGGACNGEARDQYPCPLARPLRVRE